jgi:UDP-N-acetylmuramoyl-tripeptide--D-alanyl-D-alanine ligase
MIAMMNLQTALGWLQGAQIHGDASVAITRVHTDTRSIEPGDLFVALQGETFDANALLHEAQQRGAAAVLCHAGRPAADYPAGLPRIEVPDTRLALGQLAAGWRAQFTLPLIAVTGSNGKTTVTQMIGSILRAHAPGDASLATQGNLNNDIGVPMTLLRLRASHRIAVVEMGMNHPGEIAALAAMVQPTVALVNNAQREHLEFMQTVAAVAAENGAALAALPADGVAVFPSDDAHADVWEALAAKRRVARFALAAPAVAQATSLGCVDAQWRDGGWQVHARGLQQDFAFALHIAGRHNVKNALAAASCALSAGVPVEAVVAGLEAFAPVKGRSRAFTLQAGARAHTVVDDTYNANPDSMRAAVDVLAELPGPRLLVLGDMGEVGTQGPQFHAEVGQYAHSRGIEQVFATGVLAQHLVQACPGAQHFADMPALQAAVLKVLPQAGSVLVKGSRFMRMERVVESLQAHAAAQGAA